jgi:CO/xanthine dehydrogenase FAD-binding subunit
MAIAHDFDYCKPRTLAEAVALLARHGAAARVLAGGTDLVGWLREATVAPEILVDIKGLTELGGITERNGTLAVGALVTFSDLLASEPARWQLPLLIEMAKQVGSVGIRNRATVAGNICSAVPCCDSGPVLLVHEARVRVTAARGERTVPIAEWFAGPRRSALAADELVTSLEIPIPAGDHGAAYVKLGRYRGEDLAQASVAVLALPEREYRIAFGAVAPTPVRAPKIEALLRGRDLEPEILAEAQGLVSAETAPISDVRASREYRALMLPIMFEHAIGAASARLAGDGPPYGSIFL